jgi:NAD(P)-dependent dehydrogenase (short-subunit alcohol dehydrogenase family)
MNAARFDFAGARVLVTGGTRGIGLAIATAFADAGAAVTVTGTAPSAAAYDGLEPRLRYRTLDVRDDAAIAVLARSLEGLDVLVNNAGANFARQPSEWDPAVFSDALRLNLVGAFALAVACRPLLAASTLDGGASILNVASMSAFFAVPVVPAYGAAKAGIVQMTKNLAVAWAADGIRVNAVAPGLIATRMTAGMRGVEAVEGPQLARVPMQRWGTPADVAPAFLFLASAAARFITGETVCVDGGYAAS